jgi:hypothetical protein
MLNQKLVQNQIDPAASIVIACATVMEEIIPFLPSQMACKILDFGLHINPGNLKTVLQNTIDFVPDNVNNIILGYGLCSQAVVGLKSLNARIIIPKIDDCIAIFLGSKSAYYREQKSTPGTYYLTKGWLKTASTPFDEFDSMVKKYGEDKARRLMTQILKNYTRLAFINTGTDLDEYHQTAKNMADKFGLKYQEIEGENTLVKKLVQGPWDADFIVADPGETITFKHFRTD